MKPIKFYNYKHYNNFYSAFWVKNIYGESINHEIDKQVTYQLETIGLKWILKDILNNETLKYNKE